MPAAAASEKVTLVMVVADPPAPRSLSMMVMGDELRQPRAAECGGVGRGG